MQHSPRLTRAIQAMAVFLPLSLLLLLTFFVLPRSARALPSGWYVDAANCPGPGDGSAGNPFCLIQSAVNAASPGDMIHIAAGIYTEPGIAVAQSLAFRGASASTTIVQAAASQAAATNRVFLLKGWRNRHALRARSGSVDSVRGGRLCA